MILLIAMTFSVTLLKFPSFSGHQTKLQSFPNFVQHGSGLQVCLSNVRQGSVPAFHFQLLEW